MVDQLKRIGTIALVASVAVAGYLVNRTPDGPPVDPDLLADTRWRIVTINDDPWRGWIRFDGEWVTFTSGLNEMSFRYEVDGDKLVNEDGSLFSTLVGSLDSRVTATEQRLGQAMSDGRMRLEGNRLTVGDGGATVVAELREP